MNPWEIWTYDFPVEGLHPCVIFSNASRLQNPAFDTVNVLLCRTLRGPLQRLPKIAEIVLDQSDGLEWATLCRVDVLHLVPKVGLHQRRGVVCRERRFAISKQMVDLLPFEF